VTVNAARVRLQVTASPDVVTQTTYEVQCDTGSTLGKKSSARTPLTREIRLPRSPASANDVQCSISARATKPANATMTVALLVPGSEAAAKK
jgi:hypothetical protein